MSKIVYVILCKKCVLLEGTIAAKRRRRLMFYVKMFCVVFFSFFDATAQHWLNGFSQNLHRQMSFQGYSLMVFPHASWSPTQKVACSERLFLEQKIKNPSSLYGCCTEMRRNSCKTKTSGISTISRLPSHTILVKFDSGNLSYRGLINCAFWPLVVQRIIGLAISQN